MKLISLSAKSNAWARILESLSARLVSPHPPTGNWIPWSPSIVIRSKLTSQLDVVYPHQILLGSPSYALLVMGAACQLPNVRSNNKSTVTPFYHPLSWHGQVVPIFGVWHMSFSSSVIIFVSAIFPHNFRIFDAVYNKKYSERLFHKNLSSKIDTYIWHEEE